MDAKQERMMRQVEADSPKYAGIFRKGYEGRVSPRHAIKAFCLQCCWLDRSAITSCTDTACPLWKLRPYQSGKKGIKPEIQALTH